ncbi:MAG: hypothetical protein IIA88_03590 [Bacteroidetes bacterium]|nr:hypothetical protein [Bacteroidota bacterium]
MDKSNTFKRDSGKKSRSIFRLIEIYLRVGMFDQGLPVKYIPYLIYIITIGIFYIWNTHFSEKTIRELDKITSEVEDLRANYTTLKADYMFKSKQSEVAKRVARLGLYESSEPPFKIVVKKR